MNFTKHLKPKAEKLAQVTIYPSKAVLFNRLAVEKFKLAGYQYISLHHDKDNKVLGFEFSKNNCGHAERIHSNGEYVVIEPKEFIKTLDINISQPVVIKLEKATNKDKTFLTAKYAESKKCVNEANHALT